jgi:hypothetical protein
MNSFIFDSDVYHFVSDRDLFKGASEYIGEFEGLKEAKEYLEGLRMSEDFVCASEEKVVINESAIALALYESGHTKMTQSKVASFKRCIEEKRFVPDDVVLDLRESYGLKIMESKTDYTMSDGSVVLIDIETNRLLNNILDIKESSILVQHMTKNSTNFMQTVQDLLEDN